MADPRVICLHCGCSPEAGEQHTTTCVVTVHEQNAALRAQVERLQAAGQVAIDYTPGKWFRANTADELEAFFLSRLPAIREAAKAHGYAVGLHGSLRRDLDLIAVPWRDGASDGNTLAHAIAFAACGLTRDGQHEWEAKPAGRVATSVPCCWTSDGVAGSGHIDLSIMATPAPSPAPVAQEAADTGAAFFSYDSEAGFKTHDTAEKARASADKQLTIYREEAQQDCEWADEVNGLCWGVILSTVVMVPMPGAQDDSCDYVLPPARAALAARSGQVAASAMVPLTDEQIVQIAEDLGIVGPRSRVGDLHARIGPFARAIEAGSAKLNGLTVGGSKAGGGEC